MLQVLFACSLVAVPLIAHYIRRERRARLRLRLIEEVASKRWTRTDEIERETLRLEHLVLTGKALET